DRAAAAARPGRRCRRGGRRRSVEASRRLAQPAVAPRRRLDRGVVSDQRPERNGSLWNRRSGVALTIGMMAAQNAGTYASAAPASSAATMPRAASTAVAKRLVFLWSRVMGVSTGPSLSVVTLTPAA